MSTHDNIESISNRDKQDIINTWDRFLSGEISVQAVEQHFHVLTGERECLDSIEWYVTEWRGW